MVDLQDAAGLGGHWPVALLRWHLHEATVVEANGHARHLLGLPPGAPDAWPAWLGGGEPAPPGWEPLHEVLMQVDDGAVLSKPWLRLVAGRPVMWQLSARRVGAEVWLVAQDVGAAFLGNPRVHYQHLADRVRGPREHLIRWRAWAAWAVVRRVRPDFPADPRHEVREPADAAIETGLRQHGIEGEIGTWRAALSGCR